MNNPLPPALSNSLLPVSRILKYVLQSSYDLFDRKGTTSFWNYQTLDAKNVIAHQDNDRAVMAAYGFPVKTMTESQCVAELFKLYQQLTK